MNRIMFNFVSIKRTENDERRRIRYIDESDRN